MRQNYGGDAASDHHKREEDGDKLARERAEEALGRAGRGGHLGGNWRWVCST